MKVYKSKEAEKNILSTYNVLLSQWGVPVTEIDVPTQYGTTHINICGKENGIPLVLFHGVGDNSAMMWIYNAAALASEFKIYAVDTIGGPGKSRPGANYNKTFDDAIWIDEILNYLRLDKVNIAGVSNGGYLCQLYCVLRPNRVNKAVCMASSVAAKGSGNAMLKMMRIFLPEALFPTKGNIIKLLKKLTGKNSAAFIENPIILEHFIQLSKGFNNMAMGYHKIILFSDEQIAVIREKCLFLVGNNDPFTIMGGKKMLDKYKMKVKYFDNVGHGINHEISEEINEMLINTFIPTNL